MLAAFNNPQNTHKTIHVAGTSGKGTICYFIDAILRAHGKRSALLVSPHVYDLRERIQINGQFIPEKVFLQHLNQLLPLLSSHQQTEGLPAYFTIMTMLGFIATADFPLDYVVVETGMGGRLDPTNVIQNEKYCVLGQIGLDHTEVLGTTFEQIAAEKAGIMQPGSGITALGQKQSVNEVFEQIAKKQTAKLSWVESSGDYEIDDYLLAVDAVRNVAARDGWHFNEELVRAAVDDLFIPGRYEQRNIHNRPVILDGAHNPQKLAALSSRILREEKAPCTVILALGDHKDFRGSLAELKKITSTLICTEFFTHEPRPPKRAIPAQKLADTAKELGFLNIKVVASPVEALHQAARNQETIVVTGSFYLLGEIDSAFN